MCCFSAVFVWVRDCVDDDGVGMDGWRVHRTKRSDALRPGSWRAMVQAAGCAVREPVLRGGPGWLEVGELFVVGARCEEDVARGNGHYVEEGEDVLRGEDQMALRIDFLRVGRCWDW